MRDFAQRILSGPWFDVEGSERGCLLDASGKETLCGSWLPLDETDRPEAFPDFDPPKTYCGSCLRLFLRSEVADS